MKLIVLFAPNSKDWIKRMHATQENSKHAAIRAAKSSKANMNIKSVVNYALLALLVSFQLSFSIEYNVKCFILGTLSDYMGRNIIGNPENHLDCKICVFHTTNINRNCRSSTIDSLLIKYNSASKSDKIEYEWFRGHSQKNEKGNGNEYTFLCSEKLATFINGCYNFKATGSYKYLNGKINPLFFGTLKDSIFLDSHSEYSFLAGVFSVYGYVLDSIYCIEMTNSESKLDLIQNILKKHGAKVFDKWHSPPQLIPRSRGFSFIPTNDMLPYLKTSTVLKCLQIPNRKPEDLKLGKYMLSDSLAH